MLSDKRAARARVMTGLLALASLAGPLVAPAQQTAPGGPPPAEQPVRLDLETIIGSRRLAARPVEGFQFYGKGSQYTRFTERGLELFDVATGRPVRLLIGAEQLAVSTPDGPRPLDVTDIQFSQDGRRALVLTQTRPIYRRSSRSVVYTLDLTAPAGRPVLLDTAHGGVQNATLTPDGLTAAWVRGNNVYRRRLPDGPAVAVTSDGAPGQIINGALDWVYEEEFEFAQGLYFSPDGRYLAYYRFDERAVPEYNLQLWQGLYPAEHRYKYPKAGEANSGVTVHIHHLATGQTVPCQTGPAEADQYLARVRWLPPVPGSSTPELAILRLNRLQQHLEWLLCRPADGASRVIYEERDPRYVEVTDNTYEVPARVGGGLIITSEQAGYRHIYYLAPARNGGGYQPPRALTSGAWDVEEVFGVSEQGQVFFTARRRGPATSELYRTPLAAPRARAAAPTLVTTEPGTHQITMTPDLRYLVDTWSRAGKVPITTLREAMSGRVLKTLEDNAALAAILDTMRLSPITFSQLPVSDSVQLDSWRITPPGFDPSKKYPVLLFCYGGPGSNTVVDQWQLQNYFWCQYMARLGYVVMSVDNRGTGGHGAAFRKAIYGRLGRLESDDQAAAARYLATQPWVDADRIGLWGWSYGGYLTALTLTRYPRLFKAGISVAPVTNWRFYDTIYTERYLGLPQDNARGYDDNSPARLATRLRSKFMIIHGTGDDNVHFQNSAEMVKTMIAADIPFESAYYPDRNHGIGGGKTRLHLYRLMTDFWQRNL